jgi:hypothetical protein
VTLQPSEQADALLSRREAAQRAVWAAPWVPVALAVRAYREWRRLGLADRLCWLALGLAAAYIAARIFVSWWWGE